MDAHIANAARKTIETDARFFGARELLRQLDEVIALLPAQDRTDVLAARDLSIEVHLKQKDRPDGTPYVEHPLRVALNVAVKFGVVTKDTLIAALLHDSVEDQADAIIKRLGGASRGITDNKADALRLLGERFGRRVSEIVGRLTNPNFDEMAMQAQLGGDSRSTEDLTIQFYKDHFIEIFEQDPEAFLIKLADFSENAFALGSLPDGPKKDWLRAKYGPVIVATQERLAGVPKQGHVLSAIKMALSAELAAVYARDYATDSLAGGDD